MGLFVLAAMWMFILLPLAAKAAPYADYVIDARTGQVLHEDNAHTRLHPASLTKMMTLYITFQALERGEISLDTPVRISTNAAAEPPSKLGLKPGQKIAVRYLIRAAAIKSANDAATALGEAVGGSEAGFVRRMNATAKALGMSRTTFKNAHGLTADGHLSTAHDMTILGRHLLYDYPDYYHLFSRRTADAGVREVANTNTRFLNAYKGADGIKTGYTAAAGFNLVASAERGNERVIVTVFGGRSTAARNARVAQLMDLGFKKAPSDAPLDKPAEPVILVSKNDTIPSGAGKVIRLNTAVTASLRPMARPSEDTPSPTRVAMKNDILAALAEAQNTSLGSDGSAAVEEAPNPKARPKNLVVAKSEPKQAQPEEREVVTRVSTSGGKHWGINLGKFPNRSVAEKVLVKTALSEMATLDGSLRKVVDRKNGYEANFLGLDRDTAELACKRLQARNMTCFMISPNS